MLWLAVSLMKLWMISEDDDSDSDVWLMAMRMTTGDDSIKGDGSKMVAFGVGLKLLALVA